MRIIITNNCNAYILPPIKNNPKVCGFCYRQTNNVISDSKTVDLIFKRIKKQKSVKNIVLTGGEPTISEFFDEFIERSYELGKYTLIHTNGINLEQKLVNFKKKIPCISLPVDGSRAEIQDYYRGKGFFDLTINNLKLLRKYKIDIAINTFVSQTNMQNIPQIAKMVSKYYPKYWLISQFRQINLCNRVNSMTYFSDVYEFVKIIQKVKNDFSNLNIYYLTSNQKSYPSRLWIQADGKVFTDLNNRANNIYLGDLKENTLQAFITKMDYLKLEERGDSNE